MNTESLMPSPVRDTRGSIAVEFALILPVFLLLMLGGLELGFVLYTGSSIQNAARNAVRQLALGTLDRDDLKASIDAAIPSWAVDAYTFSISDSDPGDKSKNEITVLLAVDAAQAAPIQFLTPDGLFDFSIRVVMKEEDYI